MAGIDVSVQICEDGSYRVFHRPSEAKYLRSHARWINGPVFLHPDGQHLLHLQYGLGSGPWIIMKRSIATGKATRWRNSPEWAGTREEAEDGFREFCQVKKCNEVR